MLARRVPCDHGHLRQILERGGAAVALHQRGRSHDQTTQAAEAAVMQAGIGQGPHADRHVDAFGDQVLVIVGQTQVE